MNSATLPSFWDMYRKLDRNLKAKARKAYRLWSEDPFHPSLGYRALGILEGDTLTWFWVGSHDEYERFFG